MKLMLKYLCLASIFAGGGLNAFSNDTFTPYTTQAEVPQTVTELWRDYDSRSEELDVKVLKEWKQAGVVTRYITFKVARFKGVDSRIAAYYSFPDNGKKNPAFVWSHGGGQRAEKMRGIYFAKQGFATVDINWGGRQLEDNITENTHWGKVDPTQSRRFYAQSLRNSWKRTFTPDEYTIDSILSPRNSNWFILTVAAKRAITFLEQQSEVDADRIGFAGFSMGGEITSMVSIDPRLKAVVPFVGGTGYRHVDFPGGLFRTSIKNGYKNLPLYVNTMDPSSYWPLVTCPVMFLSSSNDFNGAFDRMYKGMESVKHKNWRISTNIHENHWPSAEQWVLLEMWFDQHLKAINQNIPKTPASTFDVNGKSAHFMVTPDNSTGTLIETEIYYSYDPNPITRFWHRAQAKMSGKSLFASFPVYEKLPIYAYALCRYKLDKERYTMSGKTSTYTVNSLLQSHAPVHIDLAELKKLQSTATVEDFKYGLQDWAARDGANSITTYKFQSPFIDLSDDKKLSITVDPKGKRLRLQLQIDSRFHGKGPDLTGFYYLKVVEGDGPQNVVIDRRDIKWRPKGKKGVVNVLNWSKITRFSLSIYDVTAKSSIDLTSDEGRAVLKKIAMVDTK